MKKVGSWQVGRGKVKMDQVTMKFYPEELNRLYKRIWNKEPVEVHVALMDFVEQHTDEEDQFKLRRMYKRLWDE